MRGRSHFWLASKVFNKIEIVKQKEQPRRDEPLKHNEPACTQIPTVVGVA
jgi:hypothetical protein